jgi:PhzF family phenazine biosynthesis protein
MIICPLYQIDAFTNEPFAGNPAAVCLLDEPAPPSWMQAVAAEMNLAETAFVVGTRQGDNNAFALRWFAPLKEVALCGHATLAAAHALWASGRLPRDVPARFDTQSGRLTCVRKQDGWIEMDFPATPPTPVTSMAAELVEALGSASSVAVSRSAFDYLVELPSEAAVRAVQPDFAHLARLDTRGVIVTSRSADPAACDFVSRFFAPSVGINEDPVTGSAHCALAVYWERLLHRSTFKARQVSARGGTLRVALQGDRVLLAGQAVTVLRGELRG